MRSSMIRISQVSQVSRLAALASLILLFFGALAAGCDARATSTDPQGTAPSAEQKSREWESCGATVHCADSLRCFDMMCRRTTRSMVGDYYGALAGEQRGKGKLDEAVAAYTEALARYEAEKIAIPADTDCAYGGALAAAAAANSARKEQAELA